MLVVEHMVIINFIEFIEPGFLFTLLIYIKMEEESTISINIDYKNNDDNYSFNSQ
jgi:hypothetical protein